MVVIKANPNVPITLSAQIVAFDIQIEEIHKQKNSAMMQDKTN